MSAVSKSTLQANDLLALNAKAAERIYTLARRTPLDPAPRLSAELHNRIFIKREDLQSIFSFKLRGAYNKLQHLLETQPPKGVLCASAGNHAQGVSLAARELNLPAVIVMPDTTPAIKIDAVKALGAEVVIHGASFDDASAHARELADTRGLTFVHPFDDAHVIAGQSTVATEVLDELATSGRTADIVFVPVGGGGLAAGMAAVIKARSPKTKVIGVEPMDAASMTAALEAGAPPTLERVGTFADGVAVRRVGDLTFALCQAHLDGMVQVSTDEMCAAIKDLFLETRVLAEPAGAISLAGLKRYIADNTIKNKTLIAINSGANMNFDRLLHVTERANIGAQTEALLAVEIPETPGSFLTFCEAIGDRDVTEFNYRFDNQKRAHIFVGLRLTGGNAEKQRITKQLSDANYTVIDLTDNQVAKLHLRHLVGGSAPGLTNERLFRFEFPERRGALRDFLQAVGTQWNISLFHYRNHGSDFGRVLCGIQVSENDLDEFNSHLDKLGYAFWDESDNPVYQLFLASQ
ncbi:MAG: threonine ammonia-lyase, biosynthetic [Pseudomonadota bacterium]